MLKDLNQKPIVNSDSKVNTKPMAPPKSLELTQWRKLVKGQTPEEVRTILGEPKHIDGGTLADWTYSSGGHVTFYQDRLHSWNEPR